MSGAYHTIIPGSALYGALKKMKHPLANRIDLRGTNVVAFSMLHNDVEIRTELLIKEMNSDKPLEASITFPIKLYNEISQQLWWDNGNEASN